MILKKIKKAKSVSFKKKLVEEFLIPRVGKSKKLNSNNVKNKCYTKYSRIKFKTKIGVKTNKI